jgi:glycine/D-amino acid oxidase-like deaminating enzyme
MTDKFDFAIVGAGFFGVRLALLLARHGLTVALLDREANILQRASYINQARVHNGYHYPRSYSTALGSHKNYERFCHEIADCIDIGFEHIYAIAHQGSHTSAYQFQKLCTDLGLPLRPARPGIKSLFNWHLIEEVFLVREGVFNARAIRDKLAQTVEHTPAITLMKKTLCRKIDLDGASARLETSAGSIIASGVFIVGYSGINPLLFNSSLDPLDLKAEITEVCLVGVPDELRRCGITVMDGPFFSCMPMPAEGLHSLTHVRYTPHLHWDLGTQRHTSYAILEAYHKKSKYLYMVKDAQRYMPVLAKLRYWGSLFEVKTVPNKHEVDDGRPIIFHKHSEQPVCISVLGSKIDSIFELEDAAVQFLHERNYL